MGIRVLDGALDCADAPGQAALFCSTTGTAFGPLFHSGEEARDFLAWCDRRGMTSELLLLNAAEGLRPLVRVFRREVMDATAEAAFS